MAALDVGSVAPDFTVPSYQQGEVKPFHLADYRDKRNVVLAFHPANWTPV